MTTKQSLVWRLLAVLVALTLIATSCGSSSTDTDEKAAEETTATTDDKGSASSEPKAEAPASDELEGSIFISGSSTVEPISVAIAEAFEDVAPGVSVDVEGPGTGDGFKKFCSGETDISDASRKIKDKEAAECAAAGIEYTEILVGIDGIGVMTNTNNELQCVDFGDLYGLIGPESNDVNSWADANAITGTDLPDAPLDIFGPGEESGTYDSFIEIVLEDLAEERGQDANTRSTYNPSADDNVILSGIQSSDSSLGWVGYAFAANADGVKLLEVDGGNGCVAATPETIASNEYPISRNLYIYVNNNKAAESPALAGFIDFYVGDALNPAVESVGYVPLAADSLAKTQEAWATRGASLAAEAAAPAKEEAPAAEVAGEIFISGSSTVEPVSVRVAELFEDIAPGVRVDVEGPGTGDGFKKFCSGETDVSDASRQIKDKEAAECAAAGIEYTEILVGIDGIGVMTNTNNELQCVDFGDLYGLIGPESNDVKSWADANAITGTDLPDAPLDIFGPGEESGTYDSFIEIVLEDLAEERGQDANTRSTYNPSADDNVILSGIQSSDTSLGWVGYAFAANADGVKLLEVDGGDGCVAATPETIASNEYPISRNLYIYVNNNKAAESPALASFIDFYVGEGLDTAVEEVGYVPLTADSKGATREAWATRGASMATEAPAAEEAAAAPAIEIDPNVEGDIFISGSSTVEPVSVRVAELFEDVAPGVSVDVEGPGTGDGFKKFCSGETDISDASRQIKDKEAQACADAGIEYQEILVGIDGIGVMTNTNNELQCVDFGDLYGLIGPESNDVKSWADANAITGTDLPDVPLDIFGPGEESGTYDTFIEIVLEDLAEERGQEADTRSTYNPSADDNVILSGIQSSDTSLGWVGYAFAANADGVKLLEVDGGDGCVAATPETIASNEYPISRNLYIYVNKTRAAEKPALKAFIDFYVTEGLETAVEEVGYVALAPEVAAKVVSDWAN